MRSFGLASLILPLLVAQTASTQEPMTDDHLFDLVDLLTEEGIDQVTFWQRMVQMNSSAPNQIRLAESLVEANRYDEAEVAYREALRLEPNIITYERLGSFLQSQGHIDEAIALFRQALLLEQSNISSHRNVGVALQDLGLYKDAEIAFRKALQRDPEAAHAHRELGDILQVQGKSAEAEIAYREAIRVFPIQTGLPNYMDAYTRTKLGDSLASQSKFAEAAAIYKEAIRLSGERESAEADPLLNNPRHRREGIATGVAIVLVADRAEDALPFPDPFPFYPLATARYRQGQWAEAEAAYQKAIERSPEDITTHYALGNLLLNQNRTEEASASYEEAIRLEEGDSTYENLSYVLSDQGRLEDAATFYQETILETISR